MFDVLSKLLTLNNMEQSSVDVERGIRSLTIGVLMGIEANISKTKKN